MQQAYRALRIISEAQTVRIMLSPMPGDIMLQELTAACATFHAENSGGIKAFVLDFTSEIGAEFAAQDEKRVSPAQIERAVAAIGTMLQPVLAVTRANLSAAATLLLQAADFSLVAHDAVLHFPPEAAPLPESGQPTGMPVASDITSSPDNTPSGRSDGVPVTPVDDSLTGSSALRLHKVTWSVPENQIYREMERILVQLREKSAVALRIAKSSVRQAQQGNIAPLAALQQVNQLYLIELMHTKDAREGLQAFLEKRKPKWKNT